MNREQDIAFLRQTIALAQQSRDRGNHPFGSILVDEGGNVVLQAENTFTEDKGPGHAEANLARQAAKTFDWDYLTGVHDVHLGRALLHVRGFRLLGGHRRGGFRHNRGKRLGELTGDHPENLTMDLPARTVFASGRRDIDVRGPFDELEAEVLATQQGFWD